MEEGERLSKKQLAQESTIKKLRVSGKEVAAEKARLEAQLAQDQGQLATTRHALEAATASLQVTVARLCALLPVIMTGHGEGVADGISMSLRWQAAQEAHRAELQREKQHYEDLLSRARTSQVRACHRKPHVTATAHIALSSPCQPAAN